MQAAVGGFSLVELAVVLAIVALLLGGLMYTLSAQTEQRNFEETRRRLEQARELVLSFAVVNGRLPCPATAASAGDEAPTPVLGVGGPCTNYFGGLLPARAIGYQQLDASGYAVDAWGNRIRYAVAQSVWLTTCSAPVNPHFVNQANMKLNGIACKPNDLVICKSSTGTNPGANPPTCGGGGNQLTNQQTVAAIIFSIGKNGAIAPGGSGPDEAQNLAGNALFVFHTPAPNDAPLGEFDDQFTWITAGELYSRLIAAGVLP